MSNRQPDNLLDNLCVTAARMLAVDMVEQANSGHPGMPLGAAPMAYVLWHRIMRHNPANPSWIDRDRFILSPGHGSALLYALLYLTGYDLSLDDLKQFRQLGSRTPGHPERLVTPGVECTTGPLGQGLAMGVGMALAERRLAESINREEFLPVVDHFIYAIVSDGDLMEGIASEAASLAGHLCLGKLIYLYDDNRITIEGGTPLSFSEDTAKRFEACEWHVQRLEDGEDLDAIEQAIHRAQEETERPSLILVRTHIGHGCSRADSPEAHGSPLGKAVMATARQFYRWPDTPFHVPEEALLHGRQAVERGRHDEAEWWARIEAMRSSFPVELSRFLSQVADSRLPQWYEDLDQLRFNPDRPVATRNASGVALNAIAKRLPTLVGGSADLSPSTKTEIYHSKSGDAPERNLHFGVREHAMAAMANGMALHGGFLPYCGTFLVFSDYMRGAIRLSALMGLHVIYILTHDSVAVGEDGPTHQPIEQIASLRAIPDLLVIRPADGYETAAAWRVAVAEHRPVALILSRQDLPLLSASQPAGVARGAYIVAGEAEPADLILIATGSELHLALEARQQLIQQQIQTRVVSMPCWELFQEQPESYRHQILPPDGPPRMAIEAASSFGWHRWVGDRGIILSIDHFGTSAPGDQLLREYGFTAANIVAKATELLARQR
ncbi:MAG: transketolase [Magnetococcales bacterium]|nr:transketolase [Magnetococcales bacterium]